MPCHNPDHVRRHLWIPASTFIIPPSSASPFGDADDDDDSSAPETIVITLEHCECLCGFCPLNARQTFGSADELVKHVHEGHPERKERGVVLRIAPGEEVGASGSEIRRDSAGASGPGIRRNTAGVAMRDSDRKWRYENGDYVRREEGKDDET